MSTGPSALATQACWSHDNQHLGVRRIFRNGTSAYWLVALDGSSSEQLLPPREAISGGFACNFSPDNTRLVVMHRVGEFSQLFVLDLATRREQQLTTSPSDKSEASWSPDGRWLAFSASGAGGVQIWRIPAAGGPGSGEQQLTTGSERMFHPSYSPDGRWLYVQPSHRNIQRMPADGGPLRPVTHFPESGLFLEEPTISPDGRWLVYNRSTRVQPWQRWIIALDADARDIVTVGGDGRSRETGAPVSLLGLLLGLIQHRWRNSGKNRHR